jgi:hypothetical protein
VSRRGDDDVTLALAICQGNREQRADGREQTADSREQTEESREQSVGLARMRTEDEAEGAGMVPIVRVCKRWL